MPKATVSSTQIEQIVKMRSQGRSIRQTALMVDVPIHVVKYHSKKHGIVGRVAPQVNQWTGRELDVFLENMLTNGHATRFEYLSGFDGSESPVTLRCKVCGHELTRSAQVARKTKRITCERCEQGVRDAKARNRKALRDERSLAAARRRVAKRRERFIDCSTCGAVFFSTHGRKTCSDRCARTQRNRLKESYRHARTRVEQFDSSINLSELAKRDADVCHICGLLIDWQDVVISPEGHTIVGPSYPSIDHVVPIVRGGQHTWGNVKLAHHLCNSVKRDFVR